MHFGDDDHEHGAAGAGHVPPELALARVLDEITLTTVGIDVGSSTSHLMLGRVRLERLAQGLSSQFVVAERSTLWSSPILLTPYADAETIDAAALGEFVESCYDQAGIARDDVDTGVVLLTGAALRRRNAGAIAARFADESGRFVCAAAGHHREATMAALGSGAAELSRVLRQPVLNVDVGGGTTKLAILDGGEVLATAALRVGGRLLVLDEQRRVVVLDEALGWVSPGERAIEPGEAVDERRVGELATALAEVVLAHLEPGPPPARWARFLLTEPLAWVRTPQVVTVSGGVAEYLFGREEAEFGDLGRQLGTALGAGLRRAGRPELAEPRQKIRATVVGLSQFSVQVSGSTITASEDLPLRNVPVARAALTPGAPWTASAVREAVERALRQADVVLGGPLAVALSWSGDPTYARLRAAGEGLASAVASSEWARTDSASPLVVLLDADLASSLGRLLAEELDLGRPVVCLDGLSLERCDYVDVGAPVEPEGVVPVIVKSLLFPQGLTSS